MKFLNPTFEENRSNLTEYLSIAVGKEIIGLRRPPQPTVGGIENRNYYIYAKTDDENIDFVLRCEPEHIPQWRKSYDLYNLHREYLILQELHKLNLRLRTPQVWGFDHGETFGVPSFLMECLPGKHLRWTFHPSYSDQLVSQLAELIAYISTIDYMESDSLESILPVRTMCSDLAWLDENSRTFRNDPLVKYSLSWLSERLPGARSLTFCHGDPNPQNFLHKNGVIYAAIDWEFACLKNDPLGEILCVGWLHQKPELKTIFCQAFGRDVEELLWFEVCGLFGATYVNVNKKNFEVNREKLTQLVGYRKH